MSLLNLPKFDYQAAATDLLSQIKAYESEDLGTLHLTAYENSISQTCRKIMGSALSQRYLLGDVEMRGSEDPAGMGEFLFKNFPFINELESSVKQVTGDLFDAKFSDFRPLSGMHAMLCSLITLTKPGDVIYSIDCDLGGHFATRNVVENLCRKSASIPINRKDFNIDLDAFSQAVKVLPPNCVYLDMGCPLFPIPIEKIREIVGPDVLIIYDASHTYGLIAGKEFQSPLLEGADVLQGNTHKTFPGPQKGMTLFRSIDQGERLSEGLSMGLISSQHTHHSLALFITLLEMAEYGQAYAEQTLKNAQALANALSKLGIELLGEDLGFTKSNILLINGNLLEDHVEACRKLYHCNIETNSRHAYGEKVIRIGVQEVTRKGMKEGDMENIAQFIYRALVLNQDSSALREEVSCFAKAFNRVEYSFDTQD